LGLSRWRAFLMLVVTQVGTNVLVLLPLMADSDDRLQLLGRQMP
jgi:hypothetical protein